jgi:hypothetical protein
MGLNGCIVAALGSSAAAVDDRGYKGLVSLGLGDTIEHAAVRWKQPRHCERKRSNIGVRRRLSPLDRHVASLLAMAFS